jgi:hypothetical protein
VERQRAAIARAAWPLRRFESCCLRLSFRCGRAVRRATVNREAQVRSLPSELVARPRGRTGYDAGLSIRKLRVRVPPGVSGSTSIQRWEADAGKPASACRSTAACRGVGHPAGFGRRRSLVRLQPGRSRRRGVAVPASLMSSRPWVRIPPALLHRGDVAQRLEQSLVRRKVRRFESGRPRFSWWSWCNGSIRGRDPRGSGSNPAGRPSFLRTLSIGELPAL